MSLRDLVNNQPELNYTEPQRARESHPKGWEPGVKFDPETQVISEITSPPVAQVGDENYEEIFNQMGLKVPEGYRAELVEAKYDPAAWTRDEQFYEDAAGNFRKTPAVTKAVWRYKFRVVPEKAEHSFVNFANFWLNLREKPTEYPRPQLSGPGTFVTPIGDTQTHKTVRGAGIEQFLDQLDGFFKQAVQRAISLDGQINELVVPLLGDIVEGCDIFPHQSYHIDGDMRDQVRVSSLFILDYLDRMAPLFEKVRVVSVPGNHGEQRRNGKRVNRHDNYDQMVAEQVALAAGRDPHLKDKVSFMITDDQPSLTIDIRGHIYSFTHGSEYGKTAGASPAVKAYAWFKNQAAGRKPVGDSDVLVTGHYHHVILNDFGSMLFHQIPAMDLGSPEFAYYSGQDAQPGMSTWVVTPENKFTQFEVLR